MLLNFNTDVKLPKLHTTPPATAKRQPCGKRLIDNTYEVKSKMTALFKDYNWRIVVTEEDLVAYVRKHPDLGIDTETTGLNVFKSTLTGFSLGSEEDCIYVPLTHKVGHNYEGDIKNLQAILSATNLWGFNLKFDLKVLKHRAGLNLKGCWCGYLAARLMNSAEPANGLKELYKAHIDADEPSYDFNQLFIQPFDEYDPEIVGAYAAVDAMKHLRLGRWQREHMDKTTLRLLEKLELPLTHKLVDIELTGVELDIGWSKQLVKELEADLSAVQAEIAANYEGLNPGSPKQVAEWLFDRLHLPQIAGRSTGESVLALIDHPLAQSVLDYRKSQKLLSTYARKMPEIADDGVIHCTFNQYGADTGRFSSSEPNLQNIPRDNRFRKMFKAREGHTLVSCDYSQQEVYILAALADDSLMKDAFAKGYDFYGYMASIVFGVPYEDCQKHCSRSDLRDAMKSIVLALNYDKGIRSLSKDIGKTIEETKGIYKKFFARCPRVKEFRQEKLNFAEEHGYVETILGRRRYFTALGKPDFECQNADVLATLNRLRNSWAINKLIADAGKEGIKIIDNRKQKVVETRRVVNSIVQGSAADMTKLALLAATEDSHLNGLGMRILLQVHDEIIAEFPDETAQEGAKCLSELMIDVGTDLIGMKVACSPALMKYWEKD